MNLGTWGCCWFILGHELDFEFALHEEVCPRPACTCANHGDTTCAGWMQELLEVFAVTWPKRKEFANDACACMCLSDVLVCVLVCVLLVFLATLKVLVDRISKPASLLEEFSQ